MVVFGPPAQRADAIVTAVQKPKVSGVLCTMTKAGFPRPTAARTSRRRVALFFRPGRRPGPAL
jgi:hypothetical protein